MPDSAYPVTPSRAARTRRGSRALATAGAATLALLAAGTTTAHAEPPPETPQARTGNSPLLKCRLRTAPGARITFSPAVSSTPSHISAHGAVNLDDCTSPNGRQLHIKSGKLVLGGSGLATCFGVKHLQGAGAITWYAGRNRTGRAVGRTTVRPPSRGGRGYAAIDSFLSGKVVSGLMQGHSLSGTVVPTNDVTTCLTNGLGAIEGRGTLTVG